MIEFKELDKPTLVIKDKPGKCLNCGFYTNFYDGGYFCTYDCRKDYIQKELEDKEI